MGLHRIPRRFATCDHPCARRAAMSSRAGRCTVRSNGSVRWRRRMGPNGRCGRGGVNGRPRDRWSHSPALCGTNYSSNPQGKQPKSPYLAHGALPGSPEQASQYHRCPSIRGGFTEAGCRADCPPMVCGRKAFFSAFVNTSTSCRLPGERWRSCGGQSAA